MNKNSKEGKILSGIGGLYRALTTEGEVVECVARGVLRYGKNTPYPGDNVQLSQSETGRWTIEKILPRRNNFSRPNASNIDVLAVTVAAADPLPSYITIDKLLCAGSYYGSEGIIVITKSELSPEKSEEIKGIYEKCGYRVFLTSSYLGYGLDELKEYLEKSEENKTVFFAGESGAGKSSLINSLYPQLKLKTSAVSRKISRGRHTTRAVTLYPIGNEIGAGRAFLADTPGFGMFDLSGIDNLYKEDVCGLFPEFEKFSGNCRYTKCTHLREEGCGVIAAVKNGDIPQERHESFVRIYEEIKKAHPYRVKKEK